MQGIDRTFNFVISNSLTSLQTTMQTNLNLEMEKLQRRKSRADEIRTVGYKSFEFSASVSKKNRIFWDMGIDRKKWHDLGCRGTKGCSPGRGFLSTDTRDWLCARGRMPFSRHVRDVCLRRTGRGMKSWDKLR